MHRTALFWARTRRVLTGVFLTGIVLVLGSCGVASNAEASDGSTSKGIVEDRRPSIVVSYSILASIVKELVGDKFRVTSLIPNGLDVHEWEPSAQDIEHLFGAQLVVENGIGLEEGLAKVFAQARAKRIPFFTASDHIDVRHVGPGEGIPSEDPDQQTGAEDPHLWTDPVSMKSIVVALSDTIRGQFGSELGSRAAELVSRLDGLDKAIAQDVQSLPEDGRVLITGHESLGYFAQRYGFKLSGAIIPSLSTQAGVSASDMAALSAMVKKLGVRVIFTEMGTAPKLAQSLAKETGAKLVELSTHALLTDGSYFSFMNSLAQTIVGGLR